MQRIRLLAPALAILAGLAATWAALEFGGGAAAPTLQDPGAAVRYGVPMATMLRNLAIAAAFGGIVLACFALVPRSRDWHRTLDLAAAAAGVATVAQGFVAFGSFRQVVSNPVTATNDFGQLLQFFFVEVETGRLLLGTLLSLALLTVLLLIARSPVAAGFTVALWAVPFWLIASGGHAGGTANHTSPSRRSCCTWCSSPSGSAGCCTSACSPAAATQPHPLARPPARPSAHRPTPPTATCCCATRRSRS